MTYADRLNEARRAYPFSKWRQRYDHGLMQYTEENCDRTKKIFDDLIAGLIAKGENAAEDGKVELFRIAIEATNVLDEELDHDLIETDEREELCELTNVISDAAGLDSTQYGGGEGLASEWREW